MYSVTIIDDDRAQRELLAAMIMRSPAAARLEFMDASAAAGASGPLSADIALVDIDLGEDLPSGIDLVRDTAGNKTQVIYVTGYVDYVSDVYETAHVGFLIKPVDQQRLNDALARAIARLDQDGAGDFVVHTGSSTLRVAPNRVVYIESNRRKLQIHEGGGSSRRTASSRTWPRRCRQGLPVATRAFLSTCPASRRSAPVSLS